jgi:glycosyltransferase involved in cell wall biosynthesis
MKASIIIPANGREDLLERAIDSIIKSPGSENVEILIIDDNSSPRLSPRNLREQDKLVKLSESAGAAVARNKGMGMAIGDVIYLLDSDDYILFRDFDAEHKKIIGSGEVFFSDIKSQGYNSNYPETIIIDEYLDSIFFKLPHVTQTSSLCFERLLNLRFDESLPKHQDWDFIYFSVLLKGIQLRHIESKVFFDRGDRASLSRKYIPEKSDRWFSKLKILNTQIDIELVTYYLFAHYLSRYSWLLFIKNSIKLFFSKKVTTRIVLVKIYHRFKQL